MSQNQQFPQPPTQSKFGLYIGLLTVAVLVILVVMNWPAISAELTSRNLLPAVITDKPLSSASVPVVVNAVAGGPIGSATAVSLYANTSKPPQTLKCPTGKVLKTGYATYNSTANPSCWKSITIPQADGKNSVTIGPDFTPWIPAGTCNGDNMNLIFQYECV
jgi:hypothetical protein